MLAALMNSDVATWYENELRSAKNSQLVAVTNIPLEIPIHFLISRNASNNETKSVFDCMMKEYKDETIAWSIKYFKKPQKTETVYTPKIFSEAVKTTHFVVLGTIPVVLKAACLCVCLYALPPVGFFRLHDISDIREKFGSTIFCCEHFLGASAKFLHLYLRIYFISPPKTKTPANRLLERKRYDIMFGIRRKDDIY